MIATTVEDLYEAVRRPGGLTARLEYERLTAHLCAIAGVEQDTVESQRTIPAGADTLPTGLSL